MRWLALLSTVWAQQLFLTDTAEAFRRARKEKKELFIYFTATWCAPCQILEKKVWSDPEFPSLTSQFIRLKVVAESDEASTPGSEELCRRYGIESYPSFVLAEPSGQAYYTWSGFTPMEELEKRLQRARSMRKGIYQRRFAKGDRDPDFLWDYLQIAFELQDSAQFFPVIREYVRAKGSFKSAWEDLEAIQLLYDMVEAGDAYCQYVWQHIDSLRTSLPAEDYEAIGEALLNQLMDSIWNRYSLLQAWKHCDSIAKAYERLFSRANLVRLEFVGWKLLDSQDSLLRKEGFARVMRALWQRRVIPMDTLRDSVLIAYSLNRIAVEIAKILEKSPSAEVLWTCAALMREVVLRMPDLMGFWKVLGDVYKALREKKAALQAYQTALQKAELYPVLEYSFMRVEQDFPEDKELIQKQIQEIEAWPDP